MNFKRSVAVSPPYQPDCAHFLPRRHALTALLDKAGRIGDPFEQSFFMMVHLPYLQPFADINKRISRLAANLPMLHANLCPLTCMDVPEQSDSWAILGV